MRGVIILAGAVCRGKHTIRVLLLLPANPLSLIRIQLLGAEALV